MPTHRQPCPAPLDRRRDEEAIAAWQAGDPRRALELWDLLLDDIDREDVERPRLERNRRFAIEALAPALGQYPFDAVRDVMAVQEARRRDPAHRPTVGVTLVILSCRRYPLFVRTLSSFLRCCTDRDLIQRWICIDDGSPVQERAAMQALFPFLELFAKPAGEAGHARSLNLLRTMVDTPFVLALEDDWLFARRMDYIGRCLAVFEREPSNLQQVLFNRHYAEGPDDAYLAVRGGLPRRDAAGRPYLLHEHRPGDRAGSAPAAFAHHPHFALRPSLLRTAAWRAVGAFDESPSVDFELDYARRYTALGLASAYLDGIPCVHIGRWNRHHGVPDAAPNAYQLNGQPQYGRPSPPPRSRPARKAAGERLALAVTTCKRLQVFLRSMSTALPHCTDLHLVDTFLVVDDDSSAEDVEAMRAAFPFFRFLQRPAAERGHARSMNRLLDTLEGYDFLFHLEDDWEVRSPYSLGDALALLRSGRAEQVLLRRHAPCAARAERLDGIEYWLHEHDETDPLVPAFFRAWREQHPSEVAARGDAAGCWWPSLSLNPSLWNLRAFRARGERFDEDLDPSYFEYALSLRLARTGWRLAMLDVDMSQYPTPTAYVLNGRPRLFDGRGCEPHRAHGGDPLCPACAEQKALYGKT